MTGPYTKLSAEQIEAKLRGIRDAKPITDATERHATWDRCWTDFSSAPYFNVGNEEEFAKFCELRDALFAKYFEGVNEVVEFGCGAGANLISLMPRKLRGYDWSEPAVARCRARGIEAETFDMFNPRPVLLADCGVFTVHALEQLGDEAGPFITWLICAEPKIIVNIEPIYEFYDPLNLDEFLAMKYHLARGYLKGLLPCLEILQARGLIEILEVTKSAFGNIHHKAYSTIVWRPKP